MILEKIAQGKLQKFFKENALLVQVFVKGPRKSLILRDVPVSVDLSI